MSYTIGISTCPNDTFMFHALLAGRIDTRGLDLSFELLDVQELNDGLSRRRFHFSKASACAATVFADSYEVCSAGAALGFGVGPLLLAHSSSRELSADASVVCPGRFTTAYLLMRHLFPQATHIEQRIFSEIMPALTRAEFDYGVVIHEGRFTYARHCLKLIADLGVLWEESYNLPLPLGVIVADRALPESVRETVDALIGESIEYARSHREETFETMARYAQELNDDVIWSHVDLYVNEWSRGLGDQGEMALRKLEAVAHEAGVANGSLIIRRPTSCE